MDSRSEPSAPLEPARGSVLGPASLGGRSDAPYPAGVRVGIAPGVLRLTPTLLFGGSPPRMLRLSARGAALVSALDHEPVAEGASARLARKLTDADVAVPLPSRLAHDAPVDVTVVVPVRDRPFELDGCLASLGTRVPVVVVDDGSVDAGAVETVCHRHGAALVRREVPGGPAAARNTGLRSVTSELVAFVDSDCVAAPGWIEALVAYFVDPLVVGVAPRVVRVHGRRGGRARGASLVDMGSRPGDVHPRGAVSHVPSAAVIFRRRALGDGFDERFRYGEDVDLEWRLVDAGWRIRYAPDVEVAHRDPASVPARLRRRFAYGTSVGPLERAHPGAIDHLVLGVGPACTVGSLLAGSPGVAALAWAITTAHLHWRLRPLSPGARVAFGLSLRQLLHAWVGAGRWCTTFAVPLLSTSMLAPVGPARRARRTLAVLICSSLVARRLEPGGGNRSVLVDDGLGELAYGLGVVTGCARAGVLRPLLPRIRWRR